MTAKTLEIFQDLNLRTRSADVSIRESILSHVRSPWHHDQERENSVATRYPEEKIIALIRDASDDLDESALLLWPSDDGYRVSNIVPRNVGQLSIGQYNAILQDFFTVVAKPAADAGGFTADMTSAHEQIEHWVGAETARALRTFSDLANKSTGAGHPKDQERWFKFLVLAHRSKKTLDAERLGRWLVEVEGWPEEAARSLAIDYEFARALLEFYDSAR